MNEFELKWNEENYKEFDLEGANLLQKLEQDTFEERLINQQD